MYEAGDGDVQVLKLELEPDKLLRPVVTGPGVGVRALASRGVDSIRSWCLRPSPSPTHTHRPHCHSHRVSTHDAPHTPSPLVTVDHPPTPPRRRDPPPPSASPPPSLRYPTAGRRGSSPRRLAAGSQLRAHRVVHEELAGRRCTGEDARADQNHPLPKRKLGYSSISTAPHRPGQAPLARLPACTAVR